MVIKSIIDQHAEEAAFLWLQRDAAVREPHYLLADLAELDNRVEAHIDGLRIAGEAGWEICKEQLMWEEAGEVFAAAVLAFESGDEARIQEVLELGTSTYDLSRGVISALGWIPHHKADSHITKLLASESPDLRRIGLAASTIHRKDPGQALTDAYKDENSLLKARAFKAVGELGRINLASSLQYKLPYEEDKCQFACAWTLALFGDEGAISKLKTIALKDQSHSEDATKMAVRRMQPSSASSWIKEMSQSSEHIRKAVVGAGAGGDPVTIPWLISLMAKDEVSRVAGESFAMITGVDIAYDDLEGEWPEGYEAGPTESPEDEDVAMDPDEDLPWPEPELIQEWWDQNKSQFQTGKRYLLGKPITVEWCQQVLREGKQRQRAASAIELSMLNPGAPLFEVRAPGFRQKQILAISTKNV
jgi:uncharacterized protein (TIGR02270 family)